MNDARRFASRLDHEELNKIFLPINTLNAQRHATLHLKPPGLFIHSFQSSIMATASRYSLNKNKYLLPPETERLRKILGDFQDKDPRNCLMMWVGLRTGARAQEILNIQRSDLNPYDESIFIRGLKGSNDREIPIHSEIFNRLHRFAEKEGGAKVFDISYNRLYQIWELYRPVPKKFHSLRHTFAIELYQRTKDLRLVQVALGHRNISNTMVYADYVYSQQELRKLIL